LPIFSSSRCGKFGISSATTTQSTIADAFHVASAHRVSERIAGVADQPENLPDPDLLKRVD
jgi:hypothetical protein